MFDKDIPIPNSNRYHFDKMEVGDSSFHAGSNIKKIHSNLTNAKKKSGFKFRAKTLVEDGVSGVRVWRVE